MRRKVFSYRDGKLVEKAKRKTTNSLHSVHGDTLEKPIKNLVTDTWHDSKSSYMREIDEHNRKHGTDLQVVGNDLLSERIKRKERPEFLTDSKIKDAMDHAKAILNDPAKKREWSEHNRRCLMERDEYFR